MTSYEEIYERFLSKITDYDLPMMPEENMLNSLHGWMSGAITRFTRPTSDLRQRDDNNKTFLVTLEEYEVEVLALYMVVGWLDPRIKSTLLTNQMIGGKEEKYFSQAQHLQTLITLRDKCLNDAKKIIRDYSYRSTNSYFG